jgi:hypothetical protein
MLFAAVCLLQWAFRFHLVHSPVDSFVRVLVAAAVTLAGIPILLLLLGGNLTLTERLRHMAQRFPRSTALYAGVAVTFVLLVTVEFACRYYFRHFYTAPYKDETNWHPSPNPRLAKGDTICHQYIANDTLIYDLRYAIDSLGRRHVPLLRPDSSYREFALLQVCSFPFGYGLPDAQTFARALDSIAGVRPYNYSISGYGPQHIAGMLHTTDLRSEIHETNGRLIYLFIDDHVPRLIGSRRLIKMWAARFPYMYLEGDELRWNGDFVSGRPWLTQFYQVISKSAFIDLFDIEIPPVITDRHLKLTAKVLGKSEEEFLWHYPQGEFLVVLCPGSKLAHRLVNQLEKEGVPFVDYSQLLDMHSPEFKIHWTEGHPNGLYYQRVTEELKKHFDTHPLP